MKELLFLLLVIGCGVLAFDSSEDVQKEYRAWIDIRSDNSCLEIKAFCQAPEDCHLMYKLKARKSGESGKTKTFQSGSLHFKSQEEKCLSRLSLRVSPKDEYEIRLEVYKDGKLVATDSVIYPQNR